MISPSILYAYRLARREIDTCVVAAIVPLLAYQAVAATLPTLSVSMAAAWLWRWLGWSAVPFGAAAVFLDWVTAALLIEIAGFTAMRRSWNAITAGCHYVVEAAPYTGLIFCFAGIVRAFLAYAAAGGGPQAQSGAIGEVAFAMCASLCGCLVALLAYTLATISAHRSETL